MLRIAFLGAVLLFMSSCKVQYRSSSVVPRIKTTTYAMPQHWAVFAGTTIDGKKVGTTTAPDADVFYIYPTLLTNKKDARWNASITDPDINADVLKWIVPYQAAAWADAGRLFVPYYQQNHYRAFFEPHRNQGGLKAQQLAYEDVKAAFEYYLKHENKGRPIILAGHSQGAFHLKKILQDYFDGTQLQRQLVAAYLIGTRVLIDDFKSIKPLTSPEETGGYVSWNSYKKGKYPKYFSWYSNAVTTNPITWNDSKTSSFSQHKGVLYYDNAIYGNSLEVEVLDGMLWVSLPKVPKRFWMSFIKDYHRFDVSLFWEDIRINALKRVAQFKQDKN